MKRTIFNLGFAAAVTTLYLLTVQTGKSQPPVEIHIGNELGPEWTMGANSYQHPFIDPATHQVFKNNLYFYNTYAPGGFTYHRSMLYENMWFGNDSGPRAFAQIMEAADIRFLSVPAVHNGLDVANTWKSDRIKKKAVGQIQNQDIPGEPLPPWHINFFRYLPEGNGDFSQSDTASGNSIINVLNDPEEGAPGSPLRHNWQTNRNSGGFIIGNPNTQSNELDVNWCRLRIYYTFLQHYKAVDRYRIWFLMKKINSRPAADSLQPVLVFHVGRKEGNGSITHLSSDTVFSGNDSLTTDGWHWVEFHPEAAFNYSYRFALQWLGTPDADAVKFARMAYQGKRSEQLYGGDE